MRTLLEAAAIALFGSVVGLVVNTVRTHGLPLTAAADTPVQASACVAPPAQARITTQQARELHRTGKAVFLDVRSPSAYANGHVAEALHLPCQSTAPTWLQRIARNKTLVLYGTADGADAERVAHALGARGHVDARVLDGGFDAWRAAAGPSESGACGACQ